MYGSAVLSCLGLPVLFRGSVVTLVIWMNVVKIDVFYINGMQLNVRTAEVVGIQSMRWMF
jgi:hypothetical protein